MILRENEKLITVVRRHKSGLNGLLSLSVALALLFLFALLYFKFNFFGYGWQVFSFLMLALVSANLYKFYIWKNNTLFITSQRVVRNDQSGLFNRTVIEILYSDIHEIIFKKKGIVSIVNNYGTLIIRTPSDNKIVFNKVPDPEKVVEIINKTRSEHATPKL